MSAARRRPGGGASLTEVAVGTIRDRILDLTLAPGSHIDERLLMDRFGVSRTPAREALNRLVAEGLVEIRANRGAFVRPLELEDVGRFFDAYFVAERAAGHFCRFTDPALAGDMGALQREHAALVAAGRFLEISRVNADFHVRIARATANAHLIDFSARLHNVARRLVYFVYRMEAEESGLLDEQQAHVVAEHADIIARIRAADRDGLVRTLTDHAGRFQWRIARFVGSGRGAQFPLPPAAQGV